MSTMWISIIVLGLGIAIGVFITVLQNKRRASIETIVDSFEKPADRDDDILGVRKVGTNSQAEPKITPSISPAKKTAPASSGSIQIINVIAKKPHVFRGYELLQTLLSAGLRYGDMKIFHRHQQSNGKGPILFSLASVTEPGTFDMQTIGEFSCQGVTLFMQLSNTAFDEERYQLMLNTAEQLAEDLDGIVCDKSFTPLSSISETE